MNSALYITILGLLAACGRTDAQVAYNQSAVTNVFAGDYCIRTVDNVVGSEVAYVTLPDSQPDEGSDEISAENAVLLNIVFDPPFIANNRQSYGGDIITQVLPAGPTTFAETFTLNGRNYRVTFTIAVGGYCDNLPSTTTATSPTSAAY